jgi:UDP-N-acetylglucosamine--N-acetylmuramyl-(pentapeptide) pyrophosphoryl-undecaprenol N-acetylglucosamine transferase
MIRLTFGSDSDRVDILLVSEPGGHLLEMIGLQRAWRSFSHAWVTLDSVDTRSLLSLERVLFASGPTARSLGKLLRNLLLAWRTLLRLRPAAILTTGGAVAVPFAWVGRLLGSRIVYVECGGRADRASLSCRLIAPLADLIYVQWRALEAAVPRARYVGRIRLSPDDALLLGRPPGEPPSQAAIFATMGTTKFPFDRLIRAIDQLPNSEDAVIQTSVSGVRPVRAFGVEFLPFDTLTAYIRQAHIVITHGGIGSVLLARANGKRPIVVPRLAELGEHVDDHQIAFARSMSAEGLITLVEDLDRLPEVIADCPDYELPAVEDSEDRLSAELLAYFNALVTQSSRPTTVGHRSAPAPARSHST